VCLDEEGYDLVVVLKYTTRGVRVCVGGVHSGCSAIVRDSWCVSMRSE
jgi:hypothetical protein